MSWDGVLQKIRDILNNSAPSAIPALILGSLGLCVASSYRIIRDIIRPYFSPLRALKGPPGGTFVFGHMRAIQIDRAPGTWHQEQFDKYGPVLVYKAWLNVCSSKCMTGTVVISTADRSPHDQGYQGLAAYTLKLHEVPETTRVKVHLGKTSRKRLATEVAVTNSLIFR